MSILADGTVVEQRKATPIDTTGAVPPGTMVTVPSAPRNGKSGESPIVAVDSVHWYKDPVIWTTLGGAFLALEPVIQDALTSQTFNWRSTVLAAVLAIAAWLRNRSNTVVK